MATEKARSPKNDISADTEYLSGIIVKAMAYADSDPESSLIFARKSAEGICTDVFTREIGDPGNNRLDKLLELLANKGVLPERIKIPLRVIQQYGNYAAHIQADRQPIDRSYIDPCLTALVHVTNWYFHDFLGVEIPPEITASNNEYDPLLETADKLAPTAQTVDKAVFPESLRAYQCDGVSFLSTNDAALLADEMGLGKTVQTIIALRVVLRTSVTKRALVVAPTSLTRNWQMEFQTWAPELVVRRVVGDAEDRQAMYQLPVQVLIASYEQIRTDSIDMARDIDFEVVVLDEAQRIKNRHSRMALACRFLPRVKSWALTGTPMENSVEDLISLFGFLSPGLVDVGMPPSQIHQLIQKHFLRRRKNEVLSEMPPIVVQDIPLELSGRQEAAYTDLWTVRRHWTKTPDFGSSQAALFALITKLKQLCNYDPASGQSVKLDTLLVLLEDLTAEDDKVLIFSQYVDTLKFISARLQRIPHDFYTGEQSEIQREQALARFKQEPGPLALLISLRAGGVGLNIQEASTVLLFDRWWNPAVEDQAINRAHRFGRTRPLHVIRFLIVDTIEERIEQVLQDKRIDFERYIEEADNASLPLFTLNELRQLLELSSVDTGSRPE
jgi:SNF2 family DNA or RNA helicase